MNKPLAVRRPRARLPLARFGAGGLLGALLLGVPGPARAQTPRSGVAPAPTASPVPAASPAPPDPPAPTASPTASPDPGITLTTVPGVPDAAEEAAYTAARTPQASVVLTIPAASAAGRAPSQVQAGLAASAAAVMQPKAVGGVFPQIMLALPTAKLVANAAPPLAVVTLSYGGAWAGQPVLVRPLWGGVVSAASVGGKTAASGGGKGLLLPVGLDGTLAFSFQAPAAPRTYQVSTRLGNVASTFTFTVPDGSF